MKPRSIDGPPRVRLGTRSVLAAAAVLLSLLPAFGGDFELVFDDEPNEPRQLVTPPTDPSAGDEATSPNKCTCCCEDAASKEEESSGGWLAETSFGKRLEEKRLAISGYLDQGYTWNPANPSSGLNFGRLFDDRANDYRFNQLALTLQRELKPDPGCTDWGFKAQFMYGSDARFIQCLGFMDNITDSTVQPDIIELYLEYHLPILTENGVDIKVGQAVSLLGFESVDPTQNPVYSHNYIFNFGTPTKYTGVMTTTHLADRWDVYLGANAGLNTGTFDDNNDVWAIDWGVGWKSEDEKVNVMAMVHEGPENDGAFNAQGIDSNGDFRHIVSAYTTVNWTERLKTVTEFNWGKDEGFDAEWYGASQYFIFEVNKSLAYVVRIEIWRDDDNFVAVQYADNDDAVNFLRGELDDIDPDTVGGGATTYTDLVLGCNFKVCENVLLRPEVRWDWAAGGTDPFNDSTDNHMFTFGIDAIATF